MFTSVCLPLVAEAIEVRDVISGSVESGVDEIVKGIMDDIERFADGVEQSDDITILAVRLIG